MNNHISDQKRNWDVLLIGGPSGTGKTRLSQHLAQYFGVGLTEVDDLHLVLETMTTPVQQPTLHYWATHPEAEQFSAEQILELHISVGRVMLPALQAVINNHLESRTPLILEGDYLLPELIVQDGIQLDRVRAVFLYEPNERQFVQNFYEREPEEGEQTGRAHVSWLFGQWLQRACQQYDVPALPARPWNNLFERVRATLS